MTKYNKELSDVIYYIVNGISTLNYCDMTFRVFSVIYDNDFSDFDLS